MRVTTGRRACLLAVKVDQIQEILLAPHGFTKDPFRRFSFFLTMNRGYIQEPKKDGKLEQPSASAKESSNFKHFTREN